ncbi:MAG: hypothetical protein P1P82_16675 [Bacteroidales bacterium]|nr:hypothetical protein [Bacteroidales bacterium]MDT8430202.1 hypothetical protein [Bacteroidales bacterium]
MKKLQILIAAMLISIPALSQERSKFLYAELADKSVTLYPFYRPFGNNLDPAVTLGGGIDYKQKGNFTLFQTAQVTGYATRLIGNGVTLTSSIGYRYGLLSGLCGEATVGLGTSVFYSSREIFTMDENGSYSTAIPLNAVAVLPVDLLVGYGGDRVSIYLKYRYMIVAPYTSAMPVLPMSLLGAGVRFSIRSTSQ